MAVLSECQMLRAQPYRPRILSAFCQHLSAVKEQHTEVDDAGKHRQTMCPERNLWLPTKTAKHLCRRSSNLLGSQIQRKNQQAPKHTKTIIKRRSSQLPPNSLDSPGSPTIVVVGRRSSSGDIIRHAGLHRGPHCFGDGFVHKCKPWIGSCTALFAFKKRVEFIEFLLLMSLHRLPAKAH